MPAPPAVKQSIVRDYGRRLGLRVLVETGTYFGEMIEAQRSHFSRLWSIELDPDLYAAAARKFAASGHVTIVKGDSAAELPRILATLDGPALFWLDGHYSGPGTALGDGPTPVLAELDAVLSTPQDHCVLIDDARCFGRDEGYPTIEELREICLRHRPTWRFSVDADVIRFHPPRR